MKNIVLSNKKNVRAIILSIIFLIIFSLLVNKLFRIDKNCSDFKTFAAAQKELDKHENDIYDLDRDNDGIACEELR